MLNIFKKYVIAGLALLTFTTGALADGGYIFTKDIPFSTDPALTLDTYLPQTVTDTTAVLVLFHGGGWRQGGGDKSYLTNQGRALAEDGIIVVAPQYRFRSKAIFPAIAEDSAAAVGWAWRELRRSDGSPRALFVGGISAGAYNAALVALDQRYLEAENLPRDALNGFVSFAGALTEIVAHEPAMFPPGDDPNLWEPETYADPQDPPMLILHGVRDDTIPYSVSNAFADSVRQAGGNASNYILGNGVHSFLMVERHGSETNALVKAFLAAHPRR